MSLSSILPPSSRAEQRKQGPRLLTPNTNSIPLIDPANGRLLSLLHTAVIVLLFGLHFRTLVVDPFRVMIWDLGPLLLLRCLYCAWCIPPVGTWLNVTSGGNGHEAASSSSGSTRTTKGSGGTTGSLRKRPQGMAKINHHSGSTGWSGKVKPTLIAITLSILLPPIPLTITAHILGAPLYPPELILGTAILSVHVSLLSCLPLFYAHGVSGPAWRDVIAAWPPFDEAGVWGGSIGCVVGCWLGAIPMALDWDRDWQAWPVTVLVGCYGGWAVGTTLMGPVFLKGRRIDMSVEGPVEDKEEEEGQDQDQDQKASEGQARSEVKKAQ